jgi:hypothetical protein
MNIGTDRSYLPVQPMTMTYVGTNAPVGQQNIYQAESGHVIYSTPFLRQQITVTMGQALDGSLSPQINHSTVKDMQLANDVSFSKPKIIDIADHENAINLLV